MPRHPLTVEDLWALPRVGSPVPAPDGSEVLVPVTEFSMKANKGTTRLWRMPATGGTPRALTTAESSSGQPSWSPDGRRVAFIRKAGGTKATKPQLYVMPIDGGEPARLTDVPLGAADPRWFPDGRRIAFISQVFMKAPTLDGTRKLAEKRKKDPVKAHVTENRWFRHWDTWLTDGAVHHIFAIDVETHEVMDLTPTSRQLFDPMDPDGRFRIAPDGREIAFDACRTLPPYNPIRWGVFTVKVPRRIGPKVRASRPVLLSRGFVEAMGPVYSPDGRRIIYGMQRDPDFYADRIRLVSTDRRTRKHTVLTEAWDRSPMGWTFGKGVRTLFFYAETEARTAIFSMDLRKPKPKELVRGGWFSEPHPAGTRIFTTRQSLREPPEVVSMGLNGRRLRRLTKFTDPLMKKVRVGRVEELTFAGAGGDRVQMFVVHPPKPRRKLPLVHMIHGGPHGVFGDQWHWRWSAQAFAAPGYLVALVNFHGSTSWGQAFTRSIYGRWGGLPTEDIMAATDLLIARRGVDPKRMAVTGGSYGGYLVSWIASQTDRFACIVNHAGVADLQNEFASDVTQGWEKEIGGAPWTRLERMDRFNPMRHARGFRSPMLVIHGEKDYRVPHGQALAVYNVYKALKRPARLVYYPDENHWILKPRNSRHWYGEVHRWLGRWFRGGT